MTNMMGSPSRPLHGPQATTPPVAAPWPAFRPNEPLTRQNVSSGRFQAARDSRARPLVEMDRARLIPDAGVKARGTGWCTTRSLAWEKARRCLARHLLGWGTLHDLIFGFTPA